MGPISGLPNELGINGHKFFARQAVNKGLKVGVAGDGANGWQWFKGLLVRGGWSKLYPDGYTTSVELVHALYLLRFIHARISHPSLWRSFS